MEENKKYNLKRVAFYNATLPVIAEIFNSKMWVYYGKDNFYPQFLVRQYDNCAIHKAIVQAKVSQICGDGLFCQTVPMATVNLINPKETIDEVFNKCAVDYVLFGGYALNVVWKRDRTEGIAEIHHLDFSRIRAKKMIDDEEEVEKYFYCADWTNTKKYPPEEYDTFGVDNEGSSQIVYYKSYQPSQDYYPTPDYSGAMAAIDISIEIQNFHKNNLKNGMRPSLFINFNNGVPGDEEQRIITRGLEEQYSGSDNAGGAVISFNESKESAPTVEPVQTNATDNYYQTIYEDINRSILSGHRVSSGELFGISSAGKLGSANEIIEHSEFFRNTVIKPYINDLIPTMNKVMSLKYQEPILLKVKPLTILDVEKITINTQQPTQ